MTQEATKLLIKMASIMLEDYLDGSNPQGVK